MGERRGTRPRLSAAILPQRGITVNEPPRRVIRGDRGRLKRPSSVSAGAGGGSPGLEAIEQLRAQGFEGRQGRGLLRLEGERDDRLGAGDQVAELLDPAAVLGA